MKSTTLSKWTKFHNWSWNLLPETDPVKIKNASVLIKAKTCIIFGFLILPWLMMDLFGFMIYFAITDFPAFIYWCQKNSKGNLK